MDVFKLRESLFEDIDGYLKIRDKYKLSPTSKGDFFEEIMRNFFQKVLPSGYSVYHGNIINETRESAEIDLIVVDNALKDKYRNYNINNVIVVDRSCVKLVAELKTSIDKMKIFQNVKKNLKTVKDIGPSIPCLLITAFNTCGIENIKKQQTSNLPDKSIFCYKSTRKRGPKGKVKAYHRERNEAQVDSLIEFLIEKFYK